MEDDEDPNEETYGCRSKSCTTCTRHVAEALQTCVVPERKWIDQYPTRRSCGAATRTNLMATGWLLSMLVPTQADPQSVREVLHKCRIHIPSKTTPNEPSPIFFPSRK